MTSRFDDFLEAARIHLEDVEYKDHPLVEILLDYVEGELSTEDTARISAHLATCARCRREVARLREEMEELAGKLAQVEERIVDKALAQLGVEQANEWRATAPSPSPKQHGRDRLGLQRVTRAIRQLSPAVRTRGAPRGKKERRVLSLQLVWAASLLVILGVGIVVGSVWQPLAPSGPGRTVEIGIAQLEEVFSRVRSGLGTTPLSPLDLLRISQLLQSAGIDLSRFDLERPIEYTAKPGETLRRIARERYGDERYWILVYLLNYDYKPLQNALEGNDDLGSVKLPEGLVLVLVKKKP